MWGSSNHVREGAVDPQHELRVVTLYTSRIMDHLGVQQLLPQTVQQLVEPELRDSLPSLRHAWRLRSSLKPLVLNARALIEQASQGRGAPCGCAAYPAVFKPMQQGGVWHVCTRDLSILGQSPPARRLGRLLGKGLNHIPLQPWDREEAVEALSTGLWEGLRQLRDRFGLLQAGTLQEVQDKAHSAVLAWVESRLGILGEQQGDGEEMDQAMLLLLGRLQEEFWFTEVDKAPNVLCVVCPQLALHILDSRLSTGADFEQLAPPADPMSAMRALSTGLAAIDPSLAQLGDYQEQPMPILRFTVKTHKQPVAWRFITNAAGSCLNPLNDAVGELCSLLLTTLQDEMQQLGRKLSTWHGVQVNPVTLVESAQQVFLNLPDQILSDFSADITRCYENIPIDDGSAEGVPAILHRVANIVFGYQHQTTGRQRLISLDLRGGAALWVNRRGTAAAKSYLDATQVAQLVTVAVQSALVQGAAGLYVQRRGIPMGANYSPALCNIYLLFWERAALLRQLRLLRGADVADILKQWKYFFRFMDDTRVVNGPDLAAWIQWPQGQGDEQQAGWIYPACLGVEVTGSFLMDGDEDPVTIIYLELSTLIQPDGSYDLSLYCKEKKLPFTPLKFFEMRSCRPQAMAYTTAVGQIYRILYLHTSQRALMEAVRALMGELAGRGHEPRRIAHRVHQWLNRQPAFPLIPAERVTALRHYLYHLRRRCLSSFGA